MPTPRPHNTRVHRPWESSPPPGPFVDVPEWMGEARCVEVGGETFYPDKGGSTAPAKKVCLKCEVRTQCLEYALDNNERFGIWGGKSERERHKINRDRRIAATAAPALEVSA